MHVFTPPAPPSSGGTDQSKTPRIIRVRFGDGYSQRAEDGINTLSVKVNVAWEYLDPTFADEIESFLLEHGSTPFIWVLPFETAERVFTCESCKRSYPDQVGNIALAATLIEEFDP